MPVTSGKLRHLCEIWQPVDTVTVKGDTVISYAQQTTPNDVEYCNIEPIAGRELLFARQVRADVTHKITFRYRADVTHRTQFRWDDGVTVHKYELGPLVNLETRNVVVSVYAVEVK